MRTALLLSAALGTAFAFTRAGLSAPAPAKALPAPAAKASPSRLEITEWRYRDALEPVATAPTFDDAKWEVVKDAATGRGPGGLSHGWYRAVVTVPERLGSLPVAGKPLRLVILANDYAEVWVNGDFKFQFDAAQPPGVGKNRNSGYEIAGFNKPNVVSLGALKPGDTLPVAVLVINGPIAKPVGKYALKYARLEFAPGK